MSWSKFISRCIIDDSKTKQAAQELKGQDMSNPTFRHYDHLVFAEVLLHRNVDVAHSRHEAVIPSIN